MEVIKRKILLEDFIDKSDNAKTWGTITASTFYFNIQLNQTIDDMGLFTDINFIPKVDGLPNVVNYDILIDKLELEGLSFPFMNGQTPINFNTNANEDLILRLPNKLLSQYYIYGNNPLTGSTDSKIDDVRSYNRNTPYRAGFNINEETYINYQGLEIHGVNRVTNIDEPKVYVFDSIDDLNIGQPTQTIGLQYKDYSAATINANLFSENVDLPLTTFKFITEGWNETNTSLSAAIKEEFLLGIISRPEVENDVFIDRGVTPVLDYHLRLSEITNLGQLEQYGNGYYRIDRI
jgi:hypothetical protein